MNKRRTGKRILKRRRVFHPLAAFTMVFFAAALVSLPFAAKAMLQQDDRPVLPIVKGVPLKNGDASNPAENRSEEFADVGDKADPERLTASMDAATAIEQPFPPSRLEESPSEQEQTADNNIQDSVNDAEIRREPQMPQAQPPQATESNSGKQPPTLGAADSFTERWNLILANPWNALPDSYSVKLTQLKNGQSVDERCYPDLQSMMDDCRAAGLSPLICSSYRSQEKQETLFENKVNRLMAQGYSEEAAKIEAGKSVAVPGTSEHQLGLAVDIVDLRNQNLDKTQEKTAVQKWLMENSWKYGFILRYPSEKSDVTGIIYEPWHYRYVGKDAANEIYEQGICLEEYLIQRGA